MPHLFDEATLIEKQRTAEAAKRAEEAAAKEAADAAAAETAAAQAEAEETGRKARRAVGHCCLSSTAMLGQIMFLFMTVLRVVMYTYQLGMHFGCYGRAGSVRTHRMTLAG
jgi:hypothetical protein